MSPTDLTLNELHQLARTGLLASDWLMPLLSSPACWLAVLLIAALPGYSRRTRTWLLCAFITLLLEGLVLFALLTLPVSASWVAANGAMAAKAARQLDWPDTDPKTFSRLTALKLNLAIQDEAITADGVVDKLVKAGAPRAVTERIIMSAMASGHRQNKLHEGTPK